MDDNLYIDAGDLDLANLVLNAVTARSYRVLAEISSCCPISTKHKLIFGGIDENTGVSLWLAFVSDERWCRLHIDSKSGELVIRYAPSLQSPLTAGKDSTILQLFQSPNFVDKVRGHRLLQCKSMVEHTLLSLPVGMVNVLSFPNGVAEPMKSNAFFVQVSCDGQSFLDSPLTLIYNSIPISADI